MGIDAVKNGKLYHPVKKIWNGIVSVGSYTVDKCKKKGLDLTIWYKHPDGKREEMTIPLSKLEEKAFQLHKKVIASKYGQPYTMYDFGWLPDGVNNGSKVVEQRELPKEVQEAGEQVCKETQQELF